jgi:hypothetical protein
MSIRTRSGFSRRQGKGVIDGRRDADDREPGLCQHVLILKADEIIVLDNQDARSLVGRNCASFGLDGKIAWSLPRRSRERNEFGSSIMAFPRSVRAISAHLLTCNLTTLRARRKDGNYSVTVELNPSCREA